MRTLAVLLAVTAVIAGIIWGIIALTSDDELGNEAQAIVEDPVEYVGERVTIQGQVESFYPDAFTLGDSTWGSELLVVPQQGANVPELIRQRTGRPVVEVTGTVVDPEEVPLLGIRPFEGEAAIRATRIEVVETNE